MPVERQFTCQIVPKALASLEAAPHRGNPRGNLLFWPSPFCPASFTKFLVRTSRQRYLQIASIGNLINFPISCFPVIVFMVFLGSPVPLAQPQALISAIQSPLLFLDIPCRDLHDDYPIFKIQATAVAWWTSILSLQMAPTVERPAAK
jgi:hypothetical protein